MTRSSRSTRARLRVSRHIDVDGRQGTCADWTASHAFRLGRHSAAHVGHGADPTSAPVTTYARQRGLNRRSTARSVFVACNSSSEIVEIDVAGLEGVATHSGRSGHLQPRGHERRPKLIATNNRDQSVSIIDLRARQAKLRDCRCRARSRTAWSSHPTNATRSSPSRVMAAEPGTVVMIDLAIGKTSLRWMLLNKLEGSTSGRGRS